MLSDTPTSAMTILRPIINGQKVGRGPVPGNPHPFPQIIGIILPLISLWNYPVHKKVSTLYTEALFLLSEMAHTLRSVSAFKDIHLLSLHLPSLACKYGNDRLFLAILSRHFSLTWHWWGVALIGVPCLSSGFFVLTVENEKNIYTGPCRLYYVFWIFS